MSYHTFVDEDGNLYGSFEVFALDGSVNDDLTQDDGTPYAPGWYWWACFPGCLPDNDEPIGPFDTAEAAFQNATTKGAQS
jgi:hypothetical protein